MPNANQRAGRAWEEDAARYLREHGHPGADTIRIRHPDRGDIGGVEDWTLECKGLGPGSAGTFDMPAALDQLGKARAQTGTPYGAVLRKRRGKGVSEGFAIMPIGMLAGLMTRLAESEEA
jgi:hypothetical protein